MPPETLCGHKLRDRYISLHQCDPAMPCHKANNTLYTMDRWQTAIQNEIRNVGPQTEGVRS